MSELYLVRHAQANFGTENYDELSTVGCQQSEWLGEYFLERNIIFDNMASGDMQRHKQTLDCISRKMRLDNSLNYTALPGFNEYDFMTMSEAYGCQHPEDDLYQESLKKPGDKKAYYRLLRRVLMAWNKKQIKGIDESWQAFQQRVETEMSTLLQSAKSGSRILIVSSGGAISMFIGLVLGISAERIIDLNLQMKNTGISHFFFNKQKMNLSGFNSVPHLDHPQRIQYITYG